MTVGVLGRIFGSGNAGKEVARSSKSKKLELTANEKQID